MPRLTMDPTLPAALAPLAGLAAADRDPPTPEDYDAARPAEALEAAVLVRCFGSWPLALLSVGVESQQSVNPRRRSRPAGPPPSPAAERRRERAAQLRERGRTYAEIADALGVTRSTAYRDVRDADRGMARAARARRARDCPGCGEPMSGPEGDEGPRTCWDCALELRTGMARVRVLAALGAWHREHDRPPTVGDWKGSGGSWPAPSAVQRLFGSWNSALELAGFSVRPRGRPRAS